jgi:hypothetical protein
VYQRFRSGALRTSSKERQGHAAALMNLMGIDFYAGLKMRQS